MNNLLKFFSEVRLELSRVSWPKKDEVVKLTAIVIIVTLGVGLYAGALDFGFIKALSTFVTK